MTPDQQTPDGPTPERPDPDRDRPERVPVGHGERTPTRPGMGWLSRVPSHLPGGFRTTTVAMVVAFLLVLLLWNAVRFDPTLNENSPVYVPPTPVETTSPAPVPSSTVAPTVTPTTTAVTPTQDPDADGANPGTSVTGTTAPTTTTRAPGLQLPIIPGFGPPATTTTAP
ncbi:hypothetical protein [Rhodococcoides kroppenstedtii]|uniref:hypothetical protein n=1 Tax=Rhodococcoides kroppenstedtii TaxID=293050 RepID=UPI00362C9A08